MQRPAPAANQPYVYFVSFYWSPTQPVSGISGGFGNREIRIDSVLDEYNKVLAVEQVLSNIVLQDILAPRKAPLPNGTGIQVTILNFTLLHALIQ